MSRSGGLQPTLGTPGGSFRLGSAGVGGASDVGDAVERRARVGAGAEGVLLGDGKLEG